MSGIYINGMKMPNFGYREIRIYPDGRVIEEDECGIDEVVGMAEQVQSHGRLIDADKLCELCGIMADNSDDLFKSIWNQFKTTVEWCPTIIPTEEGE